MPPFVKMSSIDFNSEVLFVNLPASLTVVLLLMNF